MSIPYRKIVKSIKDNCGNGYYVSYSGGADSTFLLHLVIKSGVPFKVIHFNHNTNSFNDDMENHCVNVMRNEFGLTSKDYLIVKHKTGFDPNNNFECEASLWRKKNINNLLYGNIFGFDRCVTGHHRDDLVESLLMQYIKGYKQIGIEYNGENMFRPLLGIWKKDIINFFERFGIPWFEDPSNQHGEHLRNFFRNDLIPLIESRHGFSKRISKEFMNENNILF